MSLVKQLAGETAIYGISNILSRILHYLLLTFYLTRELSQDEYGIFSIMYTYAAILLVSFTYRMETAFFRFGSDKAVRNSSFSTGVISVVAISTVFLVLLLSWAGPISGWLQFEGKAHFVKIFAWIIFFDAIAFLPFARLRLENRAIRFAVIKTLNVLITIILVVFALDILPGLAERGITWASNVYDPEAKLEYVFYANLIASAVVLLCLSPQIRAISLRFDRILWKKMVVYALPLVVVSFAGVINQSFAIPLLQYLLPNSIDENLAQAGIYAAAAKLAVIMYLFTQAFNYAAEPFFFNQAKKKDSRELYAKVTYAFTICASMLFVIILYYVDLIQYILGADFRSGLDVVPVLLLAYLFLGIYFNLAIWYKLSDKTHIGALISATGAIVTLGLNFLLIPKIGYMGSAWAALACYALMSVLCYIIGRKYFPIPYNLSGIICYVFLALGLFILADQMHAYLGTSLVPKLLINTLILVLTTAGIYYLDRKNIRMIFQDQ